MTGNELAAMYEFSYGAIKRNLDGVTQDESLIIPDAGGNCLNWVLGHILVARGMLLTMTGGAPVLMPEQAEHYRRGSSPIQTGDNVLDIGTLRGLLDDSQQQLIPAVVAMAEEDLAAPVPEQHRRPPLTGLLGEALIRLHYHEGYHNGQIGLLRRLAGKEGAIK